MHCTQVTNYALWPSSYRTKCVCDSLLSMSMIYLFAIYFKVQTSCWGKKSQ
jgi:hypothetical protein